MRIGGFHLSMVCAAAVLAAGFGAPVFAEMGAGVEPAFPALRFARPVYITNAGDGSDRLLVLEQGGRVFMFTNDDAVERAEVVLDLRARVRRENNEEGLLGMAFHPGFAENRRVYLNYSARKGPRRNHISEFQMDAETGVIDPGSERVVMSVAQPRGNHNGGMIEFGPDGYLHIAMGDGGSAGDPWSHGQNRGTLYATILRIDVDRRDAGLGYAVPADNPFVNDKEARPEIWAYGLRNVWRFSFDRVTGDLWAGDVGQASWEEIDLIVKGGNYGWSVREGLHSFRRNWHLRGPFVDPVIEHGRGEARSITGGYVYRGKKIPGLVGAYVYGDFATGLVWALRYDGKRVTEHGYVGRVPELASFGEDRDGELYLVSLQGALYRLVEGAD